MSVVLDAGRMAVRGVRWYRNRLPRVRVGPAQGPPTIYYLTPDTPYPSGGIQVMYRHVDALNAAGIDAAVMHKSRDFRCTWFEHSTRVTDTTRTQLGPRDILVVTEIAAPILPFLPAGLRHVVFNQSSHLTFQRDREAVARHYAESPDLLAVLTVSEHSTEVLRHAFPQLDVRRVHLGLDRSLLHPAAQGEGRTISYMPRRGAADAELVLELLRGRGALEGWEVQALDGLSHAETAAALQRSTLFLHFTYQEGFGLPAAEAMACGNLVVGFHGYGGRELFDPDFSRPVPAGDVLTFARTVESVLAEEERRPGFCRSLGLAASAHVLATYTRERERDDVLGVYRELLGPQAGTPRPPAPRKPVRA